MKGILYVMFPLLLLCSCSGVPDGVLDRQKMADVLFDVHKAEAYMEQNMPLYNKRAEKDKLVLSVYAKHHITKAEFDSSVVWYSGNLDQFMKVYDNVYKRLDRENDSLKTLIAINEKTMVTPAGDSVDIWKEKRIIMLDPGMLATNFIFEIKSDSNFRKNDVAHLKLRVNGLPGDSSAYVLAGLSYGYVQDKYISDISRIDKDGYVEVICISDSAQNTKDLSGNITLISKSDSLVNPVYIDEILLMRYRGQALKAEEKPESQLKHKKLEKTGKQREALPLD